MDLVVLIINFLLSLTGSNQKPAGRSGPPPMPQSRPPQANRPPAQGNAARPTNPRSAANAPAMRQQPQNRLRPAARTAPPKGPPPVPVAAPRAAAMAAAPAATVNRGRSGDAATVTASAIRRWATPTRLQQQFILTEIFQPPLALRNHEEQV